MEHILLCGRRRSGRSAMIRALLENIQAPVFGYETKTMGTRPDGYHEIYLYPYGEKEAQRLEQNHVADCNTRDRVIHTEVFDTLGVACLQARKNGILVMDEIGFMESEAEAFCSAILEKFDGELPILAAVREGMDTEFLYRVKNHPSVQLVHMQPERFLEIHDQLLPVILRWEKALWRSDDADVY